MQPRVFLLALCALFTLSRVTNLLGLHILNNTVYQIIFEIVFVSTVSVGHLFAKIGVKLMLNKFRVNTGKVEHLCLFVIAKN